MPDLDAGVESIDSFRMRLRSWLAANAPRKAEEQVGVRGQLSDEEELLDVERNRVLQRQLFDAGFAGLAFPKKYGGAGLTAAHQDVMNEEILGYEFPERIQVPTFSPCASVILEFGTEEQKREHLPRMFSGEEIWMQMLSEPSGGSDVAGALTTAVRDGDEWVVNGSKIWTTGAWWSDWALMLVRTNWDAPKHRGLTVFMIRIHQPGIEVKRIEMLNGAQEFCEEFLTDVRIPDSDRIGRIDAGWSVGTRWMTYEKSLSLSPAFTKPGGVYPSSGTSASSNVTLARRVGTVHDTGVRQLIGEAHALTLAAKEGGARIGEAIASGHYSDQAAGLGRVLAGVVQSRTATIAFDIAGEKGAVWDEQDQVVGDAGIAFLMRQSNQIGGGTTEMSRNVVSERLFGMPPESRSDRDRPFRDIPRGPKPLG